MGSQIGGPGYLRKNKQTLMGLNKPNMLGQQNEAIKRMLGMTEGQKQPASTIDAKSSRQNSMTKSVRSSYAKGMDPFK